MSTPWPQYEPRGVSQMDGSMFARANCAAAAGATALDADTNGAIRTTGARIRELQSDQSGGISLSDVKEAWRRGWNRPMRVGNETHAALLAQLRAGRGRAVSGDYSAVPARYSAQPGFRDSHTVYAAGIRASDGMVRVSDPIRGGWTWWPQSVLLAYAAKLAGAGVALTGSGLGGVIPPAPGTGSGGSSGKPLTFWTIVTYPEGTPLTRAMVDAIMAKLSAGGFFTIAHDPLDPSGAVAAAQTRAVLMRHLGEPWNDALAVALQRELQGAAGAANVIGGAFDAGLGAVGAAIAGIPAALGDVFRSTALFIGLLALVILGLYLVARS